MGAASSLNSASCFSATAATGIRVTAAFATAKRLLACICPCIAVAFGTRIDTSTHAGINAFSSAEIIMRLRLRLRLGRACGLHCSERA